MTAATQSPQTKLARWLRVAVAVACSIVALACGDSDQGNTAFPDAGSTGGAAGGTGPARDASPEASVATGGTGGATGGAPAAGTGGGVVDGGDSGASAGGQADAGADAASDGSFDSGIIEAPRADVCQPLELCDGVDNDCDGLVDEDDPGGGQPCDTGLPGACATGSLSCVGGSLLCTAAVSATVELCNGIDDDCDGTVDQDNPEGGAACSTGLPGACDQGSMTCQNGTLGCAQTVFAVAELCNGIDDDCDATADQGNPESGTACNTGLFGSCAAGTTTCNAGAIDCAPITAPEVCNGLDDDCDGTPDDGNPEGGGACNTGLPGGCATGTMSCRAGVLACVANVTTPETCNGLDDDCDSSVDEGNPGGGAPCGSGQPGACGPGTETCAGGSIQCVPNGSPSAETCNGLDDDCDGNVDQGNPGGGAACSTGLLGTCSNGTLTCQGAVLVCIADAAVAETCNGVDDDCDGLTDDENPEGGAACGTGLPGVCAAGTLTCQNAALQCLQNWVPAAEACNGLDDDCDGNVDQGNPEGGAACVTSLAGICSPGTMTCQGGSLTCVQNLSPTGESCNGFDDDCDGNVDQGNPGGGAACTTGLPGPCDPGTITCTGGNLACQSIVPPTAELCNGVDDDCNGTVDQGNPEGGGACSTGLPGVCGAGTVTCNTGALTCVQDAAAASEDCNGLDDDCDGVVDNGSNACGGACVLAMPPGTPCDAVTAADLDECDDDVAACSGLNTTACSDAPGDADGDAYSAGSVDCGGDCDDTSSAVVSGAVEACDGVDNDCNGFADEVCACVPVAWDGGGNGTSWTDPLNWSPDVVPGSGPSHCVSIPAGATVTLSGPLGTGLLSLTLDGTLLHPAGSADGVTLRVVDLAIGPTGLINASGRGSGELAGPGAGSNGSVCSCATGLAGTGAGHGGLGGPGQGGTPAGGGIYGALLSPTELGSGGGRRACSPSGTAGVGGGRVRLIVPGTLTLDGTIRADATSATGCANGGGSGGSVWITAGAVTTNGAPVITADGGNGIADCSCGGIGGGGGAGGRIAIDGFSGALPAALALYARGGAPAGGAVRGGAGTLFWHGADEPLGHLDVDNGGGSGSAMTPLPDGTDVVLTDFGIGGGASVAIDDVDGVVTNDALTIRPASTLTTSTPLSVTTLTLDGTLTHVTGDADGVTVTATDIVISATGSVNTTARGAGELSGPGAGLNGNVCSCGPGLAGTGAGHGGLGGPGQSGTPAGGATYGDILSPMDLGSGGGRRACSQSGNAGVGGGRVRLVTSGTLTLDGTIRADGTSATGCANAGGSGGSVWITASSVTTSGAPLVTANGGNGIADCGCGGVGGAGGAGGRIAFDGFVGGLPPVLAMQARGGAPTGAAIRGAAGTMFWHGADETLGHLDVDNGASDGAVTPLPNGTDVIVSDFGIGAGAHVAIDAEDGIVTADALTIRSLGVVTTSTPLSATTVTVDGRLTHVAGDADGVTVHASNMTIGATGTVDASGRGFGQLSGPGAGATGTYCGCGNALAGAGAGHGGLGGSGQGGTPAGGLLYGSRQGVPMDLGSGGGLRACGQSGSAGLGGGLAHLFVDQTLTIDGSVLANATSATGCANGGGSGGSIWITAGTVTTNGAPVLSAGGGNSTGDCGCGGVGAGGGGGGRIVIVADANSLGGPIATAVPGAGASGGSPGNPGIVFQYPGADSFITLTAPPDSGDGDASGTLLRWANFTLTGTQHFHVELDDDPHFDASANHPETGAPPNAIVNETPGAPGGPLVVSSSTTPALVTGATYYWHVVAHNSGNGVVGGSRTFSFVAP